MIQRYRGFFYSNQIISQSIWIMKIINISTSAKYYYNFKNIPISLNFSYHFIRCTNQHYCSLVDVLRNDIRHGCGRQRFGHMDSDVQQTDAQRHELVHSEFGTCRYRYRTIFNTISGKWLLIIFVFILQQYFVGLFTMLQLVFTKS